MTDQPTPDEHQSLLHEAVRLLTAASRQTDIAANRERHPRDIAEFTALALAGAAANVGGVDRLLAGRPGSWEASLVGQLLVGTVGYYEAHLWQHRTEPVRVVVNVDDILADLGLWRLYEESAQLLEQEVLGALPAHATNADRYRTHHRLEELRSALEAQREAEWASYGAAFAAAVTAAASRLLPGLTVPVRVEVNTTYQSHLGAGQDMDAAACLLWDEALMLTPPPGSATPLRDHPAGELAQHLWDAGHLPHHRLNGAQVDRPQPELGLR